MKPECLPLLGPGAGSFGALSADVPWASGMRIAVIGTGYVGLVGAACLAEIGHRVVAVDADAQKVRSLQQGAVTIHEPGLPTMVTTQQATGRLRFTRDLGAALEGVELVFIAVGTPADESGATDLDAVLAAARAIGAGLMQPATIVVKSTVPVGTTGQLQQLIHGALATRGVGWRTPVVGNPEFLREGSATDDFMQPDRIVIGAHGDDAAALLRAYAPFLERGVPVLQMTPRSAELSKYAANAMFAARISFMNEIAAIADATGADIEEVRDGIGSDPRIGRDFLRPGIGYGGSCFPKDVASLCHTAVRHAVRPLMLQAVGQVNVRQQRWAFEHLQRVYAGRGGLRGRRIAVWGLAFKPGTDDLRESPALALIELLLDAGALVSTHDPVALANAQRQLGERRGLGWCGDPVAALDGADALVLATEWSVFREIAPQAIAEALRDRLVLDGRNVLDAEAFADAGLTLLQVGRPALAAREAVAEPEPRSTLRSALGVPA